jgi:hypothetical protein
VATVEKLAHECRFADATEYLKGLPGASEGPMRESLVALLDSAAEFLTAMEATLPASGSSLSLLLKDGGQVTHLAAATPGSLQAKRTTGEVAEFSWDEFTPESIHELHRVLVRALPSEAEKLRRHESAIAFEYLVGDRGRALAAAERMGQDNSEFKARWEKIRDGLPK